MVRSTIQQWRMFKAVAEHGGFHRPLRLFLKVSQAFTMQCIKWKTLWVTYCKSSNRKYHRRNGVNPQGRSQLTYAYV